MIDHAPMPTIVIPPVDSAWVLTMARRALERTINQQAQRSREATTEEGSPSPSTQYRDQRKVFDQNAITLQGTYPHRLNEILSSTGNLPEQTRLRVIGLICVHWLTFRNEWEELERRTGITSPLTWWPNPYVLVHSTLFKTGLFHTLKPHCGPLAVAFRCHAASLGKDFHYQMFHHGPFLINSSISDRRADHFRSLDGWITSKQLPRNGWFLKDAPVPLPLKSAIADNRTIPLKTDPAKYSSSYPWSSLVTLEKYLMYQWSRTLSLGLMEMRRGTETSTDEKSATALEVSLHMILSRLLVVDPLDC